MESVVVVRGVEEPLMMHEPQCVFFLCVLIP